MTENLFATLRAQVVAALRDAVPDLPDDVAARVELGPAREAAHGDATTNAALVAAKAARQKPPQLAADLAERLRAHPVIARVDVAGPGFINLHLSPAALQAQLPVILRTGELYGDSTVGGAVPVNIEYVSANPTGPMHIGHCRGAVVGDALANLMSKAGFAVTKEYYINDAGAQVQALGWAAYWRYLQVLGTPLTEDDFSAQVPGGLQYRGAYLIPVGQALADRLGPSLAGPDLTVADPSLWLDTVRDTAIAMMMEAVREDLAALGVHHDVFTSERALIASGAVDAALQRLDAQGLIYEGVLEPPKGKLPDDWEPREQLLFRATQFGDDVDRPLQKSDGSNTYFMNDIACHADKLSRGAQLLIDVWGADHGGYVPRMKAAVRALAGDSGATLDVLLCQIVHIMRGGQPVRMSKRAGTFVTLRDLIDEVGRDAVRFTMLTRRWSSTWIRWSPRRATIRCSMCSTRMRAAVPCCAPRRRCSARKQRKMRRWPGPMSPRCRPSRKLPCCGAWPVGRAAWKPRRWRESHIASRSSSMTWQPISTCCGTAARTMRPCASCSRTRCRTPWRAWPSSPPPPPSSAPGWRCWASFRSRKCADRPGAFAPAQKPPR
jgi:arginyl-tRNA synthetase